MLLKRTKWTSAAIPLTLTAALLAACGGNSNNGSSASGESTASADASASGSPAASGASAGASAAAKPDTSKKVQLTWYVLGDAHADTPKVMDEWNKMLEKDLNTTVKLNFTSWNDWQSKYNLLLASGEKIDMVFASSWANFYKYAKQGAFMDLTDMLPTYAPQTWEEVPKEDWDTATVGGKIYAVPNTNPEYTPNGLVYRDDWRQELNLPEIKDLDTLEAYMDGVKKNKKGVTPIGGKAWNEVYTLFTDYYDFKVYGGEGSVIASTSYDNPRDIVEYPFTPQFEEYVKRMKTWADKGFWASNTLSQQTEAGDLIKAGTGAIYWRNAPGAGGFITDVSKTHPDFKLAYFPFTRFHNYAIPTLPMANAMAIPKSAQNPERSLMVLDKLRNDPTYFRLMTYGIEGTNYSIEADGKTMVTPPTGMTVSKDWKPYDITSWGWRYKPNMLQTKGGWAGMDALNEEFAAESKPNIFDPISMDYEPVKAQVAAVNQVFKQYGQPLMMGLVPDPEKALETYRSKLKAAGVDKILDYVKEQANAYFDEKGIQ
jgi:putative aldouronate transport system substrate-binding protein